MIELFAYSGFGLKFESEIALEELPEYAGSGEADVKIKLAEIPRSSGEQPGYTLTDGGTLLSVPRVARFLIKDGRTIMVEPDPAASERNIRLYLLGSAMGVVLHQSGLLPLHANSVVIGNNAFAFCGHSGAGKSTLAAWFHDRGCDILADDVCVVGFNEGEKPLAYPGIPRMRLWREALEASGRIADDYPQSFEDMDKYDVPTRRSSGLSEALPLKAVYLLRKLHDGAAAPQFERLSGVAALDATCGRSNGQGSTCRPASNLLRLFRSSAFSAFGIWSDSVNRQRSSKRIAGNSD
jgi:hypothetical protein